MTTAQPVSDERITAALEEALARGEVGIQVAAYLDGRPLVDAAAGRFSRDDGRLVDGSTLFNVFSVTKAVTATALHVQASRGLVDYHERVATYWPEYAQKGKEATTVRDALSHRAGIPWMPAGVTPEQQADWEWMVHAIEQEEPVYPPGTTNCYHALIWGWIVGEIVRRTDPAHRPIDRFIREELLEPLGITDLYLGLPDSELARVAPLVGGDPPPEAPEALLKGMPRPVFPSARVYATRLAQGSVNPGAGAIANARSFARLFAMLAGHGELDGVRLLPEELVQRFTEPRDDYEAPDQYMGAVTHVGAYGYWLGGADPEVDAVIGPSRSIVQHPGAGGSVSWAELDSGLAVSICHNRMHERPAPPAALHPYTPIARAVREVAAEARGSLTAAG